MRKLFICIAIDFLVLSPIMSYVHAQQMNLNEAIVLSRTYSVEALEAKQAFVSTYWLSFERVAAFFCLRLVWKAVDVL